MGWWVRILDIGILSGIFVLNCYDEGEKQFFYCFDNVIIFNVGEEEYCVVIDYIL